MRKAEQLLDLQQIAEINKQVFTGSATYASAYTWIHTLWKTEPVYQYFVIVNTHEPEKVLGYAGFQIHGGFDRIEPVVELDQIGIATFAQGSGLGTFLILECICRIAPWLAKTNSSCAGFVTFVVWGYADNKPAMRLYAKLFTEGVCGKRTQFGDREEYMYRLRVPVPVP